MTPERLRALVEAARKHERTRQGVRAVVREAAKEGASTRAISEALASGGVKASHTLVGQWLKEG